MALVKDGTVLDAKIKFNKNALRIEISDEEYSKIFFCDGEPKGHDIVMGMGSVRLVPTSLANKEDACQPGGVGEQ